MRMLIGLTFLALDLLLFYELVKFIEILESSAWKHVHKNCSNYNTKTNAHRHCFELWKSYFQEVCVWSIKTIGIKHVKGNWFNKKCRMSTFFSHDSKRLLLYFLCFNQVFVYVCVFTWVFRQVVLGNEFTVWMIKDDYKW